RIVFVGLPVLDFLPVDMNAFMHVGHELMEMHAALTDDCAGLEEEIHEHRLAATDLPKDVQAFKWRTCLFAPSEQPTERGRFAREPVLVDALLERRQTQAQYGLARIGLDFSGRDKCRVAGAEGFGHWNQGKRKVWSRDLGGTPPAVNQRWRRVSDVAHKSAVILWQVCIFR